MSVRIPADSLTSTAARFSCNCAIAVAPMIVLPTHQRPAVNPSANWTGVRPCRSASAAYAATAGAVLGLP